MKKIFTATSEAEASLLKNTLEVSGINTTFSLSSDGPLVKGIPYAPHDIFVEDGKVEQALEIIQQIKQRVI